MYLLGIDIGTSSVKVAVVDAQTARCIASSQFPQTEAPILSLQAGWAEQEPESWWQYFVQAWSKLRASGGFEAGDIAAVGISYQMHGLVTVDEKGDVLRPSIIWCDSRAVSFGEQAQDSLGIEWCLHHLLNSPGNFTASKLAWVKQNEPELFRRIDKIMLPGDYFAFRLTGVISSTAAALSEGILWDFAEEKISQPLLDHFGFDPSIIPGVRPVFSIHGELRSSIAEELGLKAGLPVSYKAGDQPNNALSLNVLEPGEVAATAGTSGVIYAVAGELHYDPLSRVNSFAHVNHGNVHKRIGVLLCINGTGILYKWARELMGQGKNYEELNAMASSIPLGAEGLFVLPFGNGAERVLQNKMPGAQFSGIQFNRHGAAHLFRAVQEGIGSAFRYGLDIMRQNGLQPSVIRAGYANLFRSDLFAELFVNLTGVELQLFSNDGATGAALGAGIGAGIYRSPKEAFEYFRPIKTLQPSGSASDYEALYAGWKDFLDRMMNEVNNVS